MAVDTTFCQLNGAAAEVPTDKRVKRWSIFVEEFMKDTEGLQEFTAFLEKDHLLSNMDEISHSSLCVSLPDNLLIQSQVKNTNEEINHTLAFIQKNKVECDICHKSLAKSSYNQHKELHTLKKNGRKFNCGKCPKTFYTKQILKQHEKTHTQFHFVECEICRKSLQKTSLNRHKELHALKKNGRKLNCEKCPLKFYSKNDLNQHEKTHTKQFHCVFCDNNFSRRYMLRQHLVIKTCKHCKMEFCCSTFCKNHILDEKCI